jgi:hypothetical protein
MKRRIITRIKENTENSPVTCNAFNPRADVYIGNKTLITVIGNDISNKGRDSLSKPKFEFI